jgi:hypothetical protein
MMRTSIYLQLDLIRFKFVWQAPDLLRKIHAGRDYNRAERKAFNY